MESNYFKTYLFMYLPEQTITGVTGVEVLDSELHQIAEMSDKFYGLAQEIATLFNAQELKQTIHEPRKLIVVETTRENYAKAISQTKL